MDTQLDDRIDSFPRRSQMSTLALNTALPHSRAARRPVQQPVHVRLTRRGRAFAVLVLLLMVMAVLTVFGQRSAATGEAGVPVQTRTVEVGAGDTLWRIAAEVAEPGEVREAVHQIKELNALPDTGLAVGQEIAVPVG
jgi:LysM repeat protein